MRLFALFSSPFFLWAGLSHDLHVALQSMQELRVLIPDRLSVQEFAIFPESSCQEKRESEEAGSCWSSYSHFFYLRWTFSGDPIRILDRYLEFEYSAFWRTPGAEEHLRKMEALAESSSCSNAECETNWNEVSFCGNRSSSPGLLRDYLQQQSGDSVGEKKLVGGLARMNQNPFRRTDAVLKEKGDLELVTVDRLPYRVYSGADNTGTVATDRERFFFGLNIGKTVIADSEISYQLTTAPEWSRFNAQTFFCRIPSVLSQTFLFYGGYTQVQPKNADREVAKNWQLDGRYRIPFHTKTFLQELLLGYDFKEVISTVHPEGREKFHGVADINQFMVGWDLGVAREDLLFSLVLELYGNPGGITTRNKSEDYELFVPGSGPGYVYGKLTNSLALSWKGWKTSYNLNLQAASKNLLPSEQYNLSGYYAVRGFEERIVSTDNALFFNLTLQAPSFGIGKLSGLSRSAFDEFTAYLFFDYGLGSDHTVTAGESSWQSLASCGPGLRYQIDRYLSAHLDYGFQLFHHGFNNPTDSQYNFGLIVSF
ncbi:MAG: hypothetical protein KGI80_04495 [Verrucomicrobiota bacterium]|nr:hypothetical protein [Verrucomicrobiota bacterium]